MHPHRPFRFLLLGILAIWLAACQFPPAQQPPTPLVIQPAFVPTNQPASKPVSSPTPLPTLTPPATAVPQPTATYSPDLADWTILVYMDGDNDLAASALNDLNEMEAAGSSKSVNLLVQLDRPGGDGALRYRLLGDGDETAVSTPPLADLGEVNMGDPQTLADFIAWGLTTYPANRAALILWDHGAGWQGVAFDNDSAGFGLPDNLSLGDLSGALAAAQAQTNRPLLDIIAFDACLMSQLDVLAAIRPFAHYAIASEEVTPGQGWDYHSWLSRLYGQPALNAAGLARLLVDDFAAAYTQANPDDFVTMAAIDLTRLPDLTYAVESLAQTLLADPVFVAGAVSDARSGAEAFARVYASDFERYAAIDLGHFAKILAQRSPTQAVKTAAEQVTTALETAVLAQRQGSGFKHSSGVAIYFPRTADLAHPDYAAATQLPLWQQFLASTYTISFAELPPPEIHLTGTAVDHAGVQRPAYLGFQVVGRAIDTVTLIGGRYEADGRRRLLEYDTLIPEPTYLPDGSALHTWRDGVHDDFFIWDTRVTYLFDEAGNGDFVVMWPTAPGSTLFTVQGLYRRADGPTYAANLVFDHQTGRLQRIWGQGEGGAAAEIIPQPGDAFQLTNFYLDETAVDTIGAISGEPGPVLTFDAAGKLAYEWRALADGAYFLGFSAENAAGAAGSILTDLTIVNSDVQPGLTAYLDPYLGFQFLHPDDWYTPVYTDTLLYTSDFSGQTQLQVVIYPRLEPGMNPVSLKNQTLNSFGPVDLLYADEITVAGVGGNRAAYGYSRPDGAARTGVFFAFVKDGRGYVVDVDGPQAAEPQTIAAVEAIIKSWQFTDQSFGLKPGNWAQADLTAFSVAHPAEFVVQNQGDWQRFVADGHTFVALRAQPETRPSPDVLAALVRDAGQGVANFQADDPFPFSLGGEVWQRVDVQYTAVDGTDIWGFIMTRADAGQEVVAWAEAPAAAYNQLESTIFLTLIADMRLSVRP